MNRPTAVSVYLRRSLRHFKSTSLAAFNLAISWKILGNHQFTRAELHGGNAKREVFFGCDLYNATWMGTVVFQIKDDRVTDACAIYTSTERAFKPMEPLSNLFSRFLTATKRQWAHVNMVDTQHAWWLTNGKSFRLLDLPPELRHMIYRWTSINFIGPYSKNMTSRNGHLYLPNLALWLANKRIHDEATSIMALSAVFSFTKANDVERFLRSRARWMLDIKRIELNLDHVEYMQLLEPSHPAMLKLQKLRLDQLVVRFPGLYQTEEGHNHAKWARLKVCHRTALGLILCRLWDCVQGQKVILTGDVRETIKQQMEVQFEKAHSDLLRVDDIRRSLGLGLGDGDDFWDQETMGGAQIETSGGKALPSFPLMQGTWQPAAPVACTCPQSCGNADWEPM